MNSHTASNTSIRSHIRAMKFTGRPHIRNRSMIPSLSLGLVAALAFGCGSASDNAAPGNGSGNGIPTGCVIGSQGCVCDSSGRCASGQTCAIGGVCCDAITGNCSSPATNAGGNTSGTGATGNNAGVGATGNNAGVGATGNSSGTGITGCVIGSQGCICDSSGTCASGLTCAGGVCCDAKTGNCSLPATTSAGGGSSVSSNGGGNSSGTVCAPGVTGPVITDCGYPYTSSNPLTSVVFNESTVLKGIVPTGGGIATVRVFYNDEHALTLGARRVVVVGATGSTTTDYPVSALHTVPDSVYYPQMGTTATSGDQSGLDPSGRPLWPVLYLTDTTNNPNDTSGDWQQGGTPYSPNAVYGTWKSALVTVTQSTGTTVTTPDTDPASNDWNLGPGADTVPSSITSGSGTTKVKSEAYSAELVWNLSLTPGHTYRVQVIVHDGDQNKVGGDTGEACVNFCTGTDVCQPATCATYGPEACGQLSDKCGSTINCGSCGCVPKTCAEACPTTTAYGPGCQANLDEVTGYTDSCPQPSGCGGNIQCYCFIG